MRKLLVVVIAFGSLVALAPTAEARSRRCKTDRCATKCVKVCKEECKIECDKTPVCPITGVLCKAVRVEKEKWCPQEDKCITRRIPCPPVRKTRCIPQPDRVEYEWIKKEVCVPQPDIEEVYYEEQPDQCCEEVVCCPPKRIVECCIEYVPLEIHQEGRSASDQCGVASNQCAVGEMDVDQEDTGMDMEK